MGPVHNNQGHAPNHNCKAANQEQCSLQKKNRKVGHLLESSEDVRMPNKNILSTILWLNVKGILFFSSEVSQQGYVSRICALKRLNNSVE